MKVIVKSEWKDSVAQVTEDDFTGLYRSYYSTVRSLIFRFGLQSELDDLVQDVFLKAYRARRQFRGEASAKTWILSIALNTAKDCLRRRRPEVELPLDLATPAPDPLADTISSCLAQLTLPMREVLILCSIEGHSMREAAEILGIPEGTVKSRLSTARDEMKRLLKEAGVTYE